MLHCLEEHRPGKWKIRTKLFVVILIMLAVSILLFWGLWNLQESVCHVFENLHLISWFDEDTYIEQIKEDAVNYNVPENIPVIISDVISMAMMTDSFVRDTRRKS